MNKEPEFKRFFADKAESLRYDYPNLDATSIVMDVGTYEGTFAKLLQQKYGCKVYCYEPVKKFYDKLRETCASKFILCNYGLAGKTCRKNILLSMDGSSSNFTRDGELVECFFKDVVDEINSFDRSISLLKLNIEGDEFDVLEKLVDHPEVLSKIENIQVQFHHFITDCENRRSAIIEKLRKTHKMTWGYYFVWENWELIDE